MLRITIIFSMFISGINAYANQNYDCSAVVSSLGDDGQYSFVAGGFESTDGFGMSDMAFFDESPRVSIGVRVFFGYNLGAQAQYEIVRLDKDAVVWDVEHKSKLFKGDFVTNTQFENYNFMISCSVRK